MGKVQAFERNCLYYVATYNGGKLCIIASIDTTSFFQSKLLGFHGDDGAMFTSNLDLVKVLRQFARHGQEKRTPSMRVGVNSGAVNLQTAILLSKLEILDDEFFVRQRISSVYDEELDVQSVVRPPLSSYDITSAWEQYTARVQNRHVAKEALKVVGIPTAVHYPLPLNRLPSVPHSSVTLSRRDKTVNAVMSLSIRGYTDLSVPKDVVELFNCVA